MAGNRWDKNGEGSPSRGSLARNSRGECLLRVSPAWRGLRGTSFPSRRFIIMATESRYERSPRESAAIRARNGSRLAANARNEYSHREFADTVRVAGIFPDPSPGKASREAGVFGQSSHGSTHIGLWLPSEGVVPVDARLPTTRLPSHGGKPLPVRRLLQGVGVVVLPRAVSRSRSSPAKGTWASKKAEARSPGPRLAMSASRRPSQPPRRNPGAPTPRPSRPRGQRGS